MAKIHEQFVVLKFSKLVKDDDSNEVILDNDTKATLEATVNAILQDSPHLSGVIVEVEV